jgi:hypothetical protein
MTTLTRPAGALCLRWLILTSILAFASPPAYAQDAPKQDERQKLDDFRLGKVQSSAETKEVCEKYARWYVARLNDPNTIKPGVEQGPSWLVADLAKRLGPLPAYNAPRWTLEYSRTAKDRGPFLDEFGKAMVTALEGPATQPDKPLIVRINAARMNAELCRAGCDGAAQLCVKILAKPDENDAVKLYALKGLYYLFAIVPDPQIPEKTVFQKTNVAEPTAPERDSIKAITDFIFRAPPANLTPTDIDALFYVRREAVRALALCRVQLVKDTGKVVGKPSLALLKVARGDGLNPPSNAQNGADPRSVGERLAAVIGFCNLVQSREREMNLDYATYHIGRALQDLAPHYKVGDKETSTPWKVEALWLREAMTNWKIRATEMKLDDFKLVHELYDIIERDFIQPIEQNQPGALINPAALAQWLNSNMPKSKSLFKNDDKATIDIP